MSKSPKDGASKSLGKIRCLIVQLGNQERLLQSLMALRAVKQLYPRVEFHFIVDKANAEVLVRVPWIEAIHIIDRTEILRSLRSGEQRISDIMPQLARTLSPVVGFGWDYVINWSYSEASSYLGSLIPAVVKIGFSRRADRTLECGDDWSMYVHAILNGNGYQNIHLTDILTTQLLTALQLNHGESQGHDVPQESPTSKTFFKFVDTDVTEIWSQRNLSKKWITIQIDKNLWEIEQWLEFVTVTLARLPDMNIYLIGHHLNDGDLMKLKHWQRNESFADGRVISLITKDYFDVWAQAIGRSHWLISSDYSTEQLASVIGTRVLHLSSRNDVFFSSGPYGNGHYILTPSQQHINLKPSVDFAQKTFEYLYLEWSLRKGSNYEAYLKKETKHNDELSKFKLLRSRIRPTSEGGGVVYESQVQSLFTIEEWSSIVMGQVARSWYCGWVAPLGQGIDRDRISIPLLSQLRELELAIDQVSNECEKGAAVAALLSQKAKRVRAPHLIDVELKETIKDLGDQLKAIDLRIEDQAQRNPALRAFSNLSKVMLYNLQGSYLEEVSKGAVLAYKQIREGLELTRQWVKHSLKLARPVSLNAQGRELSQPERGLDL